MIRILLADDHNLVRAGVRALLEKQAGVQVVGEASDGREALALVETEKPDVVLLDITMPGLNGLEAAERITKASPRTRVVILSMHGSEGYVAHAMQLGVAGYMLKDACIEELPVLLSALKRNEIYLSPGISKRVVESLRSRAPSDVPSDGPTGVLTPRQREILQLIAEGKSTKEIAAVLDLSVKTVETHRAQLMQRLDIHDVAGLVRYALRSGIVE